jgi:hypothetical protein
VGTAGVLPAVCLATGAETRKLEPHFLHLIREPIKLGPILPRSPQEGHVTVGIVKTSWAQGSSLSPTVCDSENGIHRRAPAVTGSRQPIDTYSTLVDFEMTGVSPNTTARNRSTQFVFLLPETV